MSLCPVCLKENGIKTNELNGNWLCNNCYDLYDLLSEHDIEKFLKIIKLRDDAGVEKMRQARYRELEAEPWKLNHPEAIERTYQVNSISEDGITFGLVNIFDPEEADWLKKNHPYAVPYIGWRERFREEKGVS